MHPERRKKCNRFLVIAWLQMTINIFYLLDHFLIKVYSKSEGRGKGYYIFYSSLIITKSQIRSERERERILREGRTQEISEEGESERKGGIDKIWSFHKQFAAQCEIFAGEA